MFRIDTSTAALVAPPTGPAGTPGFFVDGNPTTGVAGTVVSADWLNGVQGELLAFLTAAGITPSKANNAQVFGALTTLFPGLVAGGLSLANPGFIRLPGGLILQWLRNKTVPTDAQGQGAYTFTYAAPFTSTVLGYSYTATNESTPGNTGRAQAGNPTLTSQAIYLGGGLVSSPTGLAVSGFIIGA